MSETETALPARAAASDRTPVVYFIDDSATMREVIKIAFRKESIQVVTCPDAASALAQFAETPPDAVITDVIMPDKDGYEVCRFIKEHEEFRRTPVVLMSGVVNRTVAEKAMAVKADELIRKPFQPQDLIARVKKLLYPASSPVAAVGSSPSPAAEPRPAAQVLGGLFAPPAAARPPANVSRPIAAAAFASSGPPSAGAQAELQKLRSEVRRLELLVKKLQSELEAQRQYCAALEADFKAAQETA